MPNERSSRWSPRRRREPGSPGWESWVASPLGRASGYGDASGGRIQATHRSAARLLLPGVGPECVVDVDLANHQDTVIGLVDLAGDVGDEPTIRRRDMT